MPTCEVCGNDYDKAFQHHSGRRHDLRRSTASSAPSTWSPPRCAPTAAARSSVTARRWVARLLPCSLRSARFRLGLLKLSEADVSVKAGERAEKACEVQRRVALGSSPGGQSA